jgi:PAS domain S-box-containing protein
MQEKEEPFATALPADAWLAAIVESSDDAIVSKTLDGVITSWNRGAEQLFGYTPFEAIGQPIFLIIPDDRVAEEEDVLARLRRGEKIDHFETVRRAKDGRRIPISLTVSPIRDSTGRIVGASKVARDISERVQADEALRRAQQEERIQLLTRLVLAQEDERRRIARELHDQLGQQLTALRLTLEMIKPRVQWTDLRSQLETLEELARQLDQDIAFRVWELRPAGLESGLGTALTKYLQSWSKHSGIQARLHTGRSTDDRVTPEIESVVYRLAQEALNNVAKHSRAASVDVALERRGEYLSLIVEDDGIGFDAATAETTTRGLGLIGMRERAALVGGVLQIDSEHGKGTTVIVRIPAAPGAPAQSV